MFPTRRNTCSFELHAWCSFFQPSNWSEENSRISHLKAGRCLRHATTMQLETFATGGEFLRETQHALEANEALNNLMLGLALNLASHPERITTQPYLAVLRDSGDRSFRGAFLMTPPFSIVVFSPDFPTKAGSDADATLKRWQAACEIVIRDLISNKRTVPGVVGANEPALSFVQTWQRLTGENFFLGMHERAYELREVIFPQSPPGRAREATLEDLDLLSTWIEAFRDEILPAEQREDPVVFRKRVAHRIRDGDFLLWIDDSGTPVALAGRSRQVPHGACIGPVYTPTPYRRRGFASAATAAMAHRILTDTSNPKEFVCLFTDLANPTSNSIYQKIGFRPVGDFDMYHFGEPPTPKK